eukprot:Selendium_serpulae@DN4484_c0_g1_i5.p1
MKKIFYFSIFAILAASGDAQNDEATGAGNAGVPPMGVIQAETDDDFAEDDFSEDGFSADDFSEDVSEDVSEDAVEVNFHSETFPTPKPILAQVTPPPTPGPIRAKRRPGYDPHRYVSTSTGKPEAKYPPAKYSPKHQHTQHPPHGDYHGPHQHHHGPYPPKDKPLGHYQQPKKPTTYKKKTKKITRAQACCLDIKYPIYDQNLLRKTNTCLIDKTPENLCQEAQHLFTNKRGINQFSKLVASPQAGKEILFVQDSYINKESADMALVNNGCCFNVYPNVRPGDRFTSNCENSDIGATNRELLDDVFLNNIFAAGDVCIGPFDTAGECDVSRAGAWGGVLHLPLPGEKG